MRRLKVLISAYACEPGKGSEPGVGWNLAREMSKNHDVWVITRANNRLSIEAALTEGNDHSPNFVYFDFPRWARWWKRGQRGVHAYYYLWQMGAFPLARRLHRKVLFDIVHHVTFVKYWTPSFMALLPVPFVWGPVGGGESTPKRLRRDLGILGTLYEAIRTFARWMAEKDPFVRLTARRSAITLATTEETARRLRRLGVRKAMIFGATGLTFEEWSRLSSNGADDTQSVIFISVGQLLHLKGYHLGLRAFAHAGIPNSRYLIVGNGPERQRLERLAIHLGVEDRVQFLGQLPRDEVFCHLRKSDVLLHPSLHDSGGWVCIEAMAAGKPVICLDVGGPATQVSEETGIKIPPADPEEVVKRLADAMGQLAADFPLRCALGQSARQRVLEQFLWETKCLVLADLYREVMGETWVGTFATLH